MATLAKQLKSLKNFDLERAMLQVVKDNDNIVLDLNTDSQLGEKGIDSKGNLLPGPYAPFTIDSKRGLSGFAGVTDHVTLFQEGDFHDGFFIHATSFPIEIDSSDSKTGQLKSEWGDIFGLTDESQSELNAHILPDVQDAYRKGLGI